MVKILLNGYFRVNIFSNFKTGLPKYNVSLICLLDASLSKYSNLLLFALNIEKLKSEYANLLPLVSNIVGKKTLEFFSDTISI